MTFPSSFLRWGNLSFEKLDPCGRVQLFQNQLDFPKGRTPEMELGRKVNLESTFPGQLFLYILGVIITTVPSFCSLLGRKFFSNWILQKCRSATEEIVWGELSASLWYHRWLLKYLNSQFYALSNDPKSQRCGCGFFFGLGGNALFWWTHYCEYIFCSPTWNIPSIGKCKYYFYQCYFSIFQSFYVHRIVFIL